MLKAESEVRSAGPGERSGGRAAGGLPAAAALACTLCFFGPTQVFLTNTGEFDYRYSDLLWQLLPLTAVAAVVCYALCLVAGRWGGVSRRVVALLLVLAALLWLQGNVLVWNFGVMDGRKIEWAGKGSYLLIDGAVWAGAILWTLVRPGWLCRIARPAALGLLGIQGAWTAALLYDHPGPAVHHAYHFSDRDKFTFSTQKNVVFLVLDSFQSDVLQELMEEDPACVAGFEGFTYFRDAMSGYPTTMLAVPFLLTGKHYDNSKPIAEHTREAFLSESSLPRRLVEAGWRTDLFPFVRSSIHLDKRVASNCEPAPRRRDLWDKELPQLLDLTLFRYLPSPLKKPLSQDWWLSRALARQGAGDNRPVYGTEFTATELPKMDQQFLEQFTERAKAEGGRPVFKYYHLYGTHPVFGVGEGFGHKAEDLSRAGYKRQVQASLGLARQVLGTLRKIGAYDNSMIVVMGDHGMSVSAYDLGVRMPGGAAAPAGVPTVRSQIKQTALPALLVKPFGAKGAVKISDAPVSTGDLPETVAVMAGAGKGLGGREMFSMSEGERRTRVFRFYEWGDVVVGKGHAPALREFEVTGRSWQDGSWRATGRIFGRTVMQAAAPSYRLGQTIRFGGGGDFGDFTPSGWEPVSAGERTWSWTGRASLVLPLGHPARAVVLEAALMPYADATGIHPQRCRVQINGRAVGEWKVMAEGVYRVEIPPEAFGEGRSEVSFDLPDSIWLRQREEGVFMRQIGVGISTLRLAEAEGAK